ncbi:MAG TPA: hypothetical protein VEP67_12425 [Thiobacillaceae bacterium]|nr:hypothetical protein [Thiobacillaceae bacterium]
MRSHSVFSCLLGTLLLAPLPAPALSAEASVNIASPADGAKLDAMEQAKLVYKVVAGPHGDHVHVYVDNKEVGILRKLEGSYTLETLAVGAHTICVKVVNKAHVPIGVEKCIKVSVE